jgi:phosphate uptake regulator
MDLDTERRDTFEEDRRNTLLTHIALVTEQVTELCMLTVEAFKNCAACLFGPEHAVALAAIQLADQCIRMAPSIHRETVTVLALWAPQEDTLRGIIRLERTSTECASIATHVRQIAGTAMSLSVPAERILHQLDAQAAATLAAIVHHVYVSLRGCLLVVATNDQNIARHIVAERKEVDGLVHVLQETARRTAVVVSRRIVDLDTVLSVVTELSQIASRASSICEPVL